MKVRRKPLIMDAMIWDGKNQDAVAVWAQGGWGRAGESSIWMKQVVTTTDLQPTTPSWRLVLPGVERDLEANVGDWIFKGVDGELYPVKPSVFALTYEVVL